MSLNLKKYLRGGKSDLLYTSKIKGGVSNNTILGTSMFLELEVSNGY